MKTKWNLLTILALLMMLVGGNVTPAHAEALPVLEQLPAPMTYVPADSAFWNSDLCISDGYPCSGADNVLVQTGTTLTITHIQFWGYYYGDPNAYTDDFTVIIHQAAPGVLGPAIYTEDHVNSLKESTGVILGENIDEYLLTLTLATPQTLQAGGYWIEIYNTGGTLTAEGYPENIFVWEAGYPDTLGLGVQGVAALYMTGWQFFPDLDLSLRLLGQVETLGDFTFSPAVLPDGEVGAGYGQHISITSGNGTEPYAVSLKEGSVLPAGMSFDDHWDNLYGYPTQAGSFVIQFVAEDANGVKGYHDYAFNVIPASAGYSISGQLFEDNNRNGIFDGSEYFTYFGETIQLDRGCDGTVDRSFLLTYYVQTYTFSNLPEFEPYCVSYYNPGYRTTTPKQVTSSLSGDMTGVNVGFAYVYLNVEVDSSLSGPVNLAYQRTITVSGGDAPYTFARTDQALPPGLTAEYNSDGIIVLSGTPIQTGEYPFVVEAWDANGAHTVQPQSLWIQTDAAATLTSSQNPSSEGEQVTFSLEFVPDLLFFGYVTFYDGDTPITGCENLYLSEGDFWGQFIDYNPATCTTSALSGGLHQIRAEFTAYYGGYASNTYTIEQAVSAPTPILTGLNPASAQAGFDDVTVTITGSNFTANSVVRWGTQALETTFVSDTQLSVVIPLSMQSVYTAQVTVYTPGGGTSDVQAFFFTWGPAGVIGQDVASGTDPSASSGPATASATGDGRLVVAQYDANPGGAPTFTASGDYFDVYAAPGNTFSQVTIVACNLHGGNKLYWWDPDQLQWTRTSPQTYNPATGCVTLVVDASSVPSLIWFQGTVFAAGADVPQYQSTGFTAPVDLGGVLNLAKAGQMIPLKWRLLDGSGNPVLNLDPASVTMTISPYTCTSGVATDAIETYATGTSLLQNLGNGYYQWNWKTLSIYANSCRKLTLKIGDWSGDGFTALFQFKK